MIEVRDPITHNIVTLAVAESGCSAHREDVARRPAIAFVCNPRRGPAAHAAMVSLLTDGRWMPRWP